MSKTFLDRMRAMIAGGADAPHVQDTQDHSTYLKVDDVAISSLQRFMNHASDDSIAISPETNIPHVQDAGIGQGYLAGQLLVATPLISEGCFQKSVVYVFAHNDDGAMGVIINQPLEMVKFSALVEGFSANEKTDSLELPVYYGGPVDRHRGFVLHSADYIREHTLIRHSDVAITASNTVLRDIAEGKGPKHAQLHVGFSGWSAGQLEQEIEQNSWIHVPTTQALIFETANDLKWATASKSLGIDMNFFSTTVGHA